MLRTILVGLDGSACSQAAVQYAIRLAKADSQRMLIGLGVVDEPSLRTPTAVPIGGGSFVHGETESLVRGAKTRVSHILEQFTRDCQSAGVAYHLLEECGNPADVVCLKAQRYDLVVLGRHTYFHFASQEGPDNVHEQVVRNSPRPVISVPEVFHDRPGILVAYDGSLQAAHALHAFIHTGLGAEVPVHVVSVAEAQLEAARCADRAVEYLSSHGIKAQPHRFAVGNPVKDMILQQIDALDCGLLVMGAYGKATLMEFFFGTETKRLLQSCRVPVFLDH